MGAISIFAHRHAGHGPAGRERRQVLAARERDEGPGRPPAGGDDGPRRQRADQALRGEVHDQPGHRASASTATWAPSSRASWPTSCCGPGPPSASSPGSSSRAASIVWAAMGDGNGSQHQWRADRAAADVGRPRPRQGASRRHVREPARARRRRAASARCAKADAADHERAAAAQGATWCATTAMPHIEVDAQTFEVRADGVPLTCPPAAVVPLCRRYLLR